MFAAVWWSWFEGGGGGRGESRVGDVSMKKVLTKITSMHQKLKSRNSDSLIFSIQAA